MADLRRRSGDRLRERYGQPERLQGSQAGDVLRALNLREKLHPRDCGVFVYPSTEAAEAFAAANREQYEHGVVGPSVVGGQIVSVVDWRSSGPQPTDPALPDEWTPEVNRG